MSLTEWQTWEPFVDALRRSAPPGAKISEFAGTIGRGGGQGTYLDDGDDAARRDHYRGLAREAARTGGRGPKADLDDALRAIAEVAPDVEQPVRVRAGEQADDDVVELFTLPPAVVSGPVTPVLEVVLEPGALPAQYRATIAGLPGAAPAPSADPDAVARLIAERLPDAVGAAPEVIAAAEAGLPGARGGDGARLPDEVRALYTAAGSGNLRLGAAQGQFDGFEIVPLTDGLLREAFLPGARFSTWTADAGTFAPEDPAGRVQAVIGSPLWFPVGTDGAGNAYAVDLAPGPNGHVGQVVLLDHELHAGAVYRAESLTALLVGRGSAGGEPDQLPDGVGQGVGAGRGDASGQGKAVGQGEASPASSDTRGKASRASSSDTEFLNLDPAAWAERLDAGTVPDTLKAAGLVPDRANPPALPDAISVANRLLELRGLESIKTVHLTRPARPERKGLLDRLFDR